MSLQFVVLNAASASGIQNPALQSVGLYRLPQDFLCMPPCSLLMVPAAA